MYTYATPWKSQRTLNLEVGWIWVTCYPQVCNIQLCLFQVKKDLALGSFTLESQSKTSKPWIRSGLLASHLRCPSLALLRQGLESICYNMWLFCTMWFFFPCTNCPAQHFHMGLFTQEPEGPWLMSSKAYEVISKPSDHFHSACFASSLQQIGLCFFDTFCLAPVTDSSTSKQLMYPAT